MIPITSIVILVNVLCADDSQTRDMFRNDISACEEYYTNDIISHKEKYEKKIKAIEDEQNKERN